MTSASLRPAASCSAMMPAHVLRQLGVRLRHRLVLAHRAAQLLGDFQHLPLLRVFADHIGPRQRRQQQQRNQESAHQLTPNSVFR